MSILIGIAVLLTLLLVETRVSGGENEHFDRNCSTAYTTFGQNSRKRYENGFSAGHADGYAEGLNEGRTDTIRKMVASGVHLEFVASSLGLSVEEIKEML